MRDILKFKVKDSDKVYTIRDGIIVCKLSPRIQSSFINLGFKENDDISEIFKKIAREYIDCGIFELVEDDEKY